MVQEAVIKKERQVENTRLGKLFLLIWKRKGPRNVPCGTPAAGTDGEDWPSTGTCCDRACRNRQEACDPLQKSSSDTMVVELGG